MSLKHTHTHSHIHTHTPHAHTHTGSIVGELNLQGEELQGCGHVSGSMVPSSVLQAAARYKMFALVGGVCTRLFDCVFVHLGECGPAMCIVPVWNNVL